MKSLFHTNSLWKGRPKSIELPVKDKIQDEIETMDLSINDLE